MADSIQVVLTAVDNLSGKLDSISGKLEGVGKGFSETQASVITMNQALGIAQKAFAVLQTTISAISEIARTTDEFKKLRLSLQTLSGSSVQAEKEFQWIKEFAKTAPVDMAVIQKGFIQLKASGIDPMNGSLKALVDSVLATGGGTQELGRAIVAVSQMAGKGVVSMEELRGQLGEAIPGAIQAMARALKLTEAELFDKIAKGSLDAKTGLAALQRGLEETFGGAAAAQMDTFSGVTSQLNNQWKQLLESLGNAGVYDLAVSGIKRMAQALSVLEAIASSSIVKQLLHGGMVGPNTDRSLAEPEAISSRTMTNIAQAVEKAKQGDAVAQALAKSLALVGQQIQFDLHATAAWQAEMDQVNAGAPAIITSLAAPWQKLAQSIDEATVALGPFQFKMKDLFGSNSDVVQGISKAAQGLADSVGQGAAAGGVAGAMMGAFQWFIGQLIQAAFGGFLKKLEKIFGAVGEMFDELWDAGLKDLVEAAVEFIRTFRPVFHLIGTVLRGILSPITAQLRALTDVIKNAAHIVDQIAKTIEHVADALNNVTGGGSSGINGIGAIVGGVINGGAGVITGGLLDSGGIVGTQRGMMLPGMPDHRLIAAHVGEKYTMPGRQEEKQGSWTINIYDSLSGTRVAEQVRLALEQMNAQGKLRLA